jgi:hypothetical protein
MPSARARPGGGGRGGGSKAALNNAAQPLPGAPQDSNKMRVTVYKAFGNGLPNTEQGKAVMVCVLDFPVTAGVVQRLFWVHACMIPANESYRPVRCQTRGRNSSRKQGAR